MQYQDFLQGVQQIGDIETLEQAELAAEASLSTLGERLHHTYTGKLQSQLPSRLKEFLAEKEGGNQFSLEEYYNRVRARAGVGYPEAVKWSRAVMSMINKTITAGLQREVLGNLPAEFAELFGEEPTTPLSPTIIE